ncbi:MAG: OpgC domain-containing protein [Pseudomonadota bacterium]
MSVTTPNIDFATRSPAAAAVGAVSRDPRLDFFRGIAMFIILLAHTPGNDWTRWIPARFGFSDATEIFVFCSGMASAIAFGRTFDRAGWLMGTSRVAFRVWQIYWAHICLFMAIAGLLAMVDNWGVHETSYVQSLNLTPFFRDTVPQLFGLVTLTYVPNYFDILPMYMVVLCLMPLYVAIARVSLPALAAVSIVMWVFAQGAFLDWLGIGHLHLAFPAEPWSDRSWFFNPFGWQLLFFTGFAFMRGWLPAPPLRPWLMALAVAFVLASLVLSNIGFRFFQLEWVRGTYIAITGCAETGFGRCNPVFDWRQANRPWFDKTDFGPLHYIHFLALAYICWTAAGEGGHRLIALGRGMASDIWDQFVAVVSKVGQQSLAVFVFSMVLARVNGYIIDRIGENGFTWALINLTGFGLLVACAHTAGWFKSQPWRAKR